jgi:hypothetical protein
MPNAEKRLEPDWRYTRLVRSVFGVLGLMSLWMVALTIGLLTLVGDIQDQRYDAYVAACRERNERHRTAVRELDRLISVVPAARRARAKANRNGTVTLIDALTPYEADCEATAKERVKR